MNLEEMIKAIEAEEAESLEEQAENSRYKEIFKLEQMLKDEGIPYRIRKMFDGWQLGYPDFPNRCNCSAIQHFGSYGSQDDLIEIMGLTHNGEQVEGYLSAEEVMSRIRAHYKGVGI